MNQALCYIPNFSVCYLTTLPIVVDERMSMEQWHDDTDKRKPEVLGETPAPLSLCTTLIPY
jgi:hypothetical protein